MRRMRGGGSFSGDSASNRTETAEQFRAECRAEPSENPRQIRDVNCRTGKTGSRTQAYRMRKTAKNTTYHAYRKDIGRNISHGKKRFFSILVITILGVMMFSGLQASCQDLRISADQFFDAQKLHDLMVRSTLGLTDEDVEELSGVGGIAAAEGIYSEEADVFLLNGSSTKVEFRTLSRSGIDEPYLRMGHLPEHSGETAVTEKFAKDTGLGIGDTVRLNTGADSHLTRAAFTITGIAVDPTDVDNPFGSVSYRSAESGMDRAFILPEAEDSDVYTAAVLRIDGAAEVNCYTGKYEELVRGVRQDIENTVKAGAEKRRTETVKADAQAEYDRQEQSAQDKLDEAKKKLDDGQAELDSSIRENEVKLADARAKLADGRKEIEAGEKKLDAAEQDLETQTAAAEQQLRDARQQIYETELGLTQQLAAGRNEDQIRAQIAALDQQNAALVSKQEILEEDAADGRSAIAQQRQQLAAKQKELGEKIRDLDSAVWYVQDRSSLSGWQNIRSDADSIESIGTVFPIVFFAVAILISLTTIARMVEEDRGLIGTYKSLGFTDREIRRKYMIYAGLACLLGSIAGTAMAFLALPTFLFTVFHIMYLLPGYRYAMYWGYAAAGPALFLGGILTATWLACRGELRQTPASLMRPKSPKAGSRVLLERVTPLWKRMTFLGKVTARNLFRYKGRMFMTISGISGCMALLLFGFAIRDSVAELRTEQYSDTDRYDLMAVCASGRQDDLRSYLSDGGEIKDTLEVEISTAKLRQEGGITAQIIVVPDGASLSDYIALTDLTGAPRTLRAEDIYVTRNAGEVLGFSGGDTVVCQLPDLKTASLPVTALVQNYLGNFIYLTESTYEQYFGAFEPNGILAHFSDRCQGLAAQKAFGEALKKRDGMLSVTVNAVLEDSFSATFRLMNAVVSIIIVMSAALAFVVLFTLQTTNISERVRELATIKVLGFYDREVHQYINRETWLLTGIGIVLGLPLGWGFAQTIRIILRLPSIYLAVHLHAASYVTAAGLTALFAVLVQVLTNRTLDRIDPATALKSVE